MCIQYRLDAWARGAELCPGAHEHRAPCLSMYVVYCMFFEGLNTDFVGNTNTIYMFNLIYIYSVIPMSACLSMGPSALLFLGARDAVKTALLLLLLSKKQYRGSTHVKCYGNVDV